ncbi:hypothetical protein C8J57DRAFT_1301324 [Mycena rebaudengoi]|nr:hypothetical protein C8J57DRAFT_1301324 [Mycena rebaudengoi]
MVHIFPCRTCLQVRLEVCARCQHDADGRDTNEVGPPEGQQDAPNRRSYLQGIPRHERCLHEANVYSTTDVNGGSDLTPINDANSDPNHRASEYYSERLYMDARRPCTYLQARAGYVPDGGDALTPTNAPNGGDLVYPAIGRRCIHTPTTRSVGLPDRQRPGHERWCAIDATQTMSGTAGTLYRRLRASSSRYRYRDTNDGAPLAG